jgi:hypothetical protein
LRGQWLDTPKTMTCVCLPVRKARREPQDLLSRRSAVAFIPALLAPTSSAAENYARHRVTSFFSIEIPTNWRITSEFNIDFDLSARERQRAAGLPPADPGRITFSAGRYLAEAPAEEIRELDRHKRDAALLQAAAGGFSIVTWLGTMRWLHAGLTFLITDYERTPLAGGRYTQGSNVMVRHFSLLDGNRSMTLTTANAMNAEYLLRPILNHIAGSLRLER